LVKECLQVIWKLNEFGKVTLVQALRTSQDTG
jgi:hypothetical protein